MNRRTINAVIVLGVISVVCILLIQMISINRTEALQERNIRVQQREDSLNLVHFADRTQITLRNVLRQIKRANSDSSDVFEAVKMIDNNYFRVEFYGELESFELGSWLSRELYDQNIPHNFHYSIYDCFDKSIEFSPLIVYDGSEFIADSSEIPDWPEKDTLATDHYFTIFFPDIYEELKPIKEADTISPYTYLVLIVVFVLLFFGFAVMVIFRQKRLSEVKTDFINNMTHELKTPISSIGLSSEMIMRTDPKDDPDKIKRYAGLIFKENKRLENQVERVLNIAKLDKHEITLKKEAFDIHELLNEVKDNIEFNQNESGGKIELELNAEKCVLNVDPVHISNVVYNLVDNAIKYCQKKPEIQIRTSNDKRGFMLEIQDNGIGIRREDLKMIFDKFYRVPTGNLHDVKGFGLGLYYVKKIVEEHQGTVYARSALNKGTTFVINFPYED